MIHARCLAAIFTILYLDRTSAPTCTRAQYTCRQLAVLIQICVDCTAINNQVNNFIACQADLEPWGGGGGGGFAIAPVCIPLATGLSDIKITCVLVSRVYI